jgi:hypothetical protein
LASSVKEHDFLPLFIEVRFSFAKLVSKPDARISNLVTNLDNLIANKRIPDFYSVNTLAMVLPNSLAA